MFKQKEVTLEAFYGEEEKPVAEPEAPMLHDLTEPEPTVEPEQSSDVVPSDELDTDHKLLLRSVQVWCLES